MQVSGAHRRSPLAQAAVQHSWWEHRRSPPPPLQSAAGWSHSWWRLNGLWLETLAVKSAEDRKQVNPLSKVSSFKMRHSNLVKKRKDVPTSRMFCRVSGVMVKLTGVGTTLVFCGWKPNSNRVQAGQYSQHFVFLIQQLINLQKTHNQLHTSDNIKWNSLSVICFLIVFHCIKWCD